MRRYLYNSIISFLLWKLICIILQYLSFGSKSHRGCTNSTDTLHRATNGTTVRKQKHRVQILPMSLRFKPKGCSKSQRELPSPVIKDAGASQTGELTAQHVRACMFEPRCCCAISTQSSEFEEEGGSLEQRGNLAREETYRTTRSRRSGSVQSIGD